MAIRKATKLPQSAVIKQILKRCSSLGKKQGYDHDEMIPADVPKGHFAVYVGENRSLSPKCFDEISTILHGFEEQEEEEDVHDDQDEAATFASLFLNMSTSSSVLTHQFLTWFC
ncbi:hypothetical protein K1719_005432 [Acacia pycnantha]|nr:hypothetical protein K1719_005432 [Acacia pycnantha]